MAKTAENVACAAVGIALGVIFCFAIIGVFTVAMGPTAMCQLSSLNTHPAERK